jgi:hypothetical protein
MSKTKTGPRARHYPLNRVRTGITYDVAEIAKLFAIHRNTVRNWLRQGLKTIDDRRPQLIHGTALRAFLGQQHSARKSACGPGEFFCFKCRAPRAPFAQMIDVAPHTAKVSKLTALCSVCETQMHRTIRQSDLVNLAGLFDLKTMASERLKDCPEANVDCDFERKVADA